MEEEKNNSRNGMCYNVSIGASDIDEMISMLETDALAARPEKRRHWPVTEREG